MIDERGILSFLSTQRTPRYVIMELWPGLGTAHRPARRVAALARMNHGAATANAG
jgi:hypothetical protein